MRTIRQLPQILGLALVATALLASSPAARSAPVATEPSFSLETIRIVPDDRETVAIVSRDLPVRTGQTVTAGILVQTRDYLTGSGHYRTVDVYTERGSRPGAIVLVVEVERARAVRLETGLGFEPLRSWYLNIIGMRVVSPLGRGGLFRAGFHQGLRSGGLYLDLDVPALLGPGLDLVADGGAYEELWDVPARDVAYYQSIWHFRLVPGVRKRLRDGPSMLLWSGFSSSRVDRELQSDDQDAPDVDPAALVPQIPHTTSFWESRLEVQLDRRDPLRPWQAGHWLGWTLKGALSDRGDGFWGTSVDAHVAVPVVGNAAAAFRARADYAGPGTPYYMRPILGGVRSLRGFTMGGLSGPRGARATWQVNGEWRQPLAGRDPRRPAVIGTVFADVGQFWDADGASHALAASIGYGALFRIRWLQTVNVEIAYPITRDLTGNPVVLHVSLGRSF